MQNYFTNRIQFVAINKSNSEIHNISIGVGQGTILGPLLFKIYIYDLVNSTNLLSVFFADDTTLIATANSIHELQELCNTELNKVNQWFEDNGLKLHPNKTKIMLINNNSELNVKINDTRIIQVGNSFNEKSMNILGIIWDSKLNWTEHLKKVIKKISTGIYIISKFRYILSDTNKKLIFDSLIRSHLTYGLALWGNSKGNMMNKLCSTIKKAVRVLGGKKKIHTEPILKKYRILNLKDEYKKQVTLLAKQLLNKTLPMAIQNDFTPNCNRSGRNNNRISRTRWINNTLSNQITNQIEIASNNIKESLITCSFFTAKNKLDNTILATYANSITCNNNGCIECNPPPRIEPTQR